MFPGLKCASTRTRPPVRVALAAAAGLTLAEDLAAQPLPGFDTAAMDGAALGDALAAIPPGAVPGDPVPLMTLR
jgi:molybdopterin biosynthesis enzyme